MTAVPALAADGVRKVYANGTTALDGISLSIDEGDFFALLGPNGAGKTTLIGIVTGLVSKTAGTVRVSGIDIDREPQRMRRAIGVVPQELNFNIFEKVIDIVVNQAGYYGMPRRVAVPRAEEILASLGLHEKRNDVSRTLSGGMKRRLLIARALVHKPRFLILDEPTAGVDVELRRGMWDFLTTLNAGGTTILLTTHYLEEAEHLCRNLAIINRGAIIASGTVRSIVGKLKSERLLLDLDGAAAKAAAMLSAFDAKAVDDATIDIEIGEGRDIGAAVLILAKANITVRTTRNKSGRLEEVFMRLTSDGGSGVAGLARDHAAPATTGAGR
ncbi:MAG: ABC transporter ATP-binding protein [Bauldia sp.]